MMNFGSLWQSAGSTWGNLTDFWGDRYNIKSGNAEADRQASLAMAKINLLKNENTQQILIIAMVLLFLGLAIYLTTKN